MEKIDISTPSLFQTFQNPDSKLSQPEDESVDLFNAAYRSESLLSEFGEAAPNGPVNQPLSKTHIERLIHAAAKGPKELAVATQEISLGDKSLAAAAVAYAASLAPVSATTFAEVAIKANPEAAAQIAASVAEVAIKANPEAAAQIAASVAEVAIKANPEAAAQIAASVAEAAIKANPEAATQIAASVAEVAIKANPEAAAQIAASVAEAAIKANPEAAAQIATSVAEVAIKANPEAAAQIAASVAEVAIKANPEAAEQIALGIVDVAVRQNPSAAPRIAGSVLAVIMNAVPTVVSSNPGDIVGRIMEAAVKIYPAAAPDIAAEMMRTALSLNPQSAPLVEERIQEVISEIAPEFSGIVGQVLVGIQNNPPTPTDAQIPSIVPAAPPQSFSTGMPALDGMVKGETAKPATPEASVPAETFSPPDQVLQSTTQSVASGVNTAIPVAQEVPKTISENILQLIANTVSKMEIGETQTTITLQETSELPGEVKLQVQIQNGKLKVSFQASDPKALAMLQNNVSALQARLQQTSGATSVQIILSDSSSSDTATDSTDAPTESGRLGKTGRSDGRDGKDKVEGKSKSGGAQQ